MSEKVLFLSAFSDEGFDRLVKTLEECGYELSDEADYRINPVMLAWISSPSVISAMRLNGWRQ